MKNTIQIKERLKAYEAKYNSIDPAMYYATLRRLMYKINELRWVLDEKPINERLLEKGESI